MTTILDSRQSRHRALLTQLTGSSNSTVKDVLTNIDSQLAKLFEDRNVLLVGGGVLLFDGGTTSLSMTAALKLEFNSRVGGGSPVIVDLGSAARLFSADGRMLYAVVDRVAGTATVTADSATLPAQAFANQEIWLIAKRRDVGSVKTIWLCNGTVLEEGQSSTLDSTISSGIDVNVALPMTGTSADVNLSTVLDSMDSNLTMLYEDRNVTLANGGFVTYLGTTVQFTEALELHFNSKEAGGGPVIVSLGSTTRTISASGRMIYAVVNRSAGTAVVTDDAATLPTVVSANQEVWLIAKRVDDGSGVKRLYFRNGAAFNEGQSARLGSAGSGSGGGNPYLETLKNTLVDSPYELVTPNIISTDSSAKFATLTGAALDIVNTVIKFTANAQVATSINMLDSAEFLTQGLDVTSVDFAVFWNTGTTLQAFAVPTSFTYEVSRDGGSNYFPLTMARVGTTNTLRGTLRFDTSTTTEATKQTLASQTTNTTSVALTNNNIAFSQAFVVASTLKVQEVVLRLRLIGTAAGAVTVSIIRDSAGDPSSNAADTVAQSNAISVASLGLNSATTTDYTFDIADAVLTAGTYHIVITTDAAYKARYVLDSSSILMHVRAAGVSPFRKTYNGTAWVTSSDNMVYIVKGRTLDLRIRLTSAGSPTYPCGLDGWGIFYNFLDTGLAGSNRKTMRFGFNSTLDNSSSFAITAFNPDPDLLSCFWVEAGQVFKSPAFQLQGNTAVFPTGTFNTDGISRGVTLIFDQNNGGAFDNSDSNARLLAANYLGSANGADDRSSPGRGIFLRRPDGTLREIALNDSDELVVYSI